MIDAEYECCKCLFQFHSEPREAGSPVKAPAACPACGHVYFKWVNYDEMAAAKFR